MPGEAGPPPLRAGDALVIVDVQSDFLPGGSLAVPRGDEVVAVLNGCLAAFRNSGQPVVATRDWHPPEHRSFQPQGGPWPPHCVAGSQGAGVRPLPQHLFAAGMGAVARR